PRRAARDDADARRARRRRVQLGRLARHRPPLGGPRHITVYDRVIVGSDGSPSSLYAVDRAHAVAAEAAAHVIVVSAYNPGEERGIAAGEGDRKELYGQAAARSA